MTPVFKIITVLMDQLTVIKKYTRNSKSLKI